MTPFLEWTLAVLAICTTVVLIVIAVYLVKFLKESALTMKSVRELTDITKQEIEPALKSLNVVLKTVSNMSNTTNKQFELVKKIIATLVGASCMVFSNIKNKPGFIGGLISGFNLFRKKRR